MTDLAAPPRRPVRPAATVIVLGTIDGEASALMVQRNPSLSFFGGYWVFPGGAIDARDSAGERDVIAAAAVAAARELSEEAGLDLDPRDLLHWGRWITPSSEPKRFDTHFFIGAARAGQQPRIIEGEVVAWSWLAQSRWSRLSESGEFPVPGPTQLVLREVADALSRHGSVPALLERERGRPIHVVMPKMLGTDEIVLPWDPQYATLPGEGLEWDDVALATRRDWPSRFR